LLPYITVGTSALISSDWYDGSHRHFEAAVYQDCLGGLVHYYNQQNGSGWHRGDVITYSAADPGSILQSDWGRYYWDGHWHGNLEVLVPIWNGYGGKDLAHYYNDGSGWHFATIVAYNVAGPASFIMSDYLWYNRGWGSYHHQFDAVVLEQGQLLVHYFNRNDGWGWQRGEVISSHATGQGSIIQSDFYNSNTWDDTGNWHRNYEVVVPEGSNLVHYFNFGAGWFADSQYVATGIWGPGSLLQSDFVTNGHGHFEVLVPQNYSLAHSVNPMDGSGWHPRSDTVDYNIAQPASFIQSDWYSWNGHFEALVSYGNSLLHYVDAFDSLGWHAIAQVTSCYSGPSEGSPSRSRSGVDTPPVPAVSADGGLAAAAREERPLAWVAATPAAAGLPLVQATSADRVPLLARAAAPEAATSAVARMPVALVATALVDRVFLAEEGRWLLGVPAEELDLGPMVAGLYGCSDAGKN
jgi:hypothetical protein